MSFSATPENKIGWKEMGFVEGQKITCLYNVEKENITDFWWDKLTVGETYIIEDLEWRFWDRVCVTTNYNRQEFVPAEFFFDTVSEKRDKKLKKF